MRLCIITYNKGLIYLKNYWTLLKADLKRLFVTRVIVFVIVIAFVLGVATGLFQSLNPANALYVSVFILPVLLFSFSLQFEMNLSELPQTMKAIKPRELLLSKITAAVLVQLIPLLFIFLALAFIRNLEVNYLLLFLVYLLGVINHIVIGLSLAIISKSYKILSLSYLVYILVFCALPIFFSNGLIPLRMQYFLVFSPAFLSGVLIDNLLAVTVYSPSWLIVLSVFLQIAYTVLLAIFVIHPYFKLYLRDTFVLSDEKTSGGDDN